ncbi:unnamed protein product [Rhodiola kirilowii]
MTIESESDPVNASRNHRSWLRPRHWSWLRPRHPRRRGLNYMPYSHYQIFQWRQFLFLIF